MTNVVEKQEWTSHPWTVYLLQLKWKVLYILQNNKNANSQTRGGNEEACAVGKGAPFH